ncbi:MAG TPA: helix-turn-helix transcriptional regulator [Pilimelia sp.]|nr:helix-turn-helix transcriptional regulator [Pilimelia sp.]
MTRPTGPTIPRRQLGERLGQLRGRAGVSQSEVADRLGCSISKIQKIEAGDVGVVRAELLLMLDAYGVTDAALRTELLELQRRGKQRGWWIRFGQVPAPFATYLDLESAATRIQIFEPMIVHGLLQTEEYARSVAETCEVGLTDEQVERQVRIRLERQRVLADDPPALHVVLDESVLRREVGGRRVMAAQLRHLAATAKRITLQVVPLARGGYPGIRGALTIFDFDTQEHSPVSYVESQGGNLYLHKSPDLRRCSQVFQQVTAVALSKQQSLKLINTVAREYAGKINSTLQ